MPNYREIVTKAIIEKGKKTFTTDSHVSLLNMPTTILGCWIINHDFKGSKSGDNIVIDGSYDVNIWYSYDNDTKTEVVKDTNTYHEVVNFKNCEKIEGEEILVRSLKQPICTKASIDETGISYTIEKTLGIELVGDTKVKIAVQEDEDTWDNLLETDKIDEEIDREVCEEFIEEKEC